MDKRRRYALKLAGLGFRIFPLIPGSKQPYKGTGWRAIATTNAEQINKWFDELPDMNYAVNCDEYHVIWDIDEGGNEGKKKHGKEEFLRAEDLACGFVEQPIFDATFRVRSPKGGYHLYFNADHGYSNSASTVIKDCDVRGPDGYVVGPGCYTFDDPDKNTVEGEYIIETDGAPADLPGWLKSLLDAGGLVGNRAANAGTAAGKLDTPAAIETCCRILRQRPPAIEGQGGDDHTLKTAQRLKDYGVTQDVCFDLMFNKILFAPTADFPEGRSWNETCEPPWSAEGMRQKVRNAYEYGNYQVGSKMDALSDFGEEGVAPPSVDGMSQMQQQLAPGEHFSAIEQPIGTDERRQRVRDAIMTPDQFLDREMDFESIVHDWFPAQGVTAVLAKRSTGKSVVLGDLCFRIACDMPWNGIDVAKDWACVYLCGEDDRGLMANFAAWKYVNNRSPAPDRLVLAPAVPNLMDAEDVKNWAEELKAKLGNRKVVLFIDTWQRATTTASQNDDKEMQKAIFHAEVLAKYLNGCAIIAFHPPKGRDDTISGSMIMENSTTAILTIVEHEGGGHKRLSVVRLKGGKEGNYAFFAIEAKTFGLMDKQGQEVTGALPEYGGGNKIGAAQTKLAKEVEARHEVVRLLMPTIQTRKQPWTMKEVSLIVERNIEQDREGIMSHFFPNTRKAAEIEALLLKLFTSTDNVYMPDGTEYVACIKGTLRYVNAGQSKV